MVDVCFANQMKKLWRLVHFFYDGADIVLRDNAVGVLGVSTMVVVIFISGWWFFWRFYRRPIRSAMKQMMVDQNVSKSCLGETSQRHGGVMAIDPLLEPKHKIFLSHSGVQKEFVDYLCQALEDECHYPFFDRCHESLPKGERFPELIVRAVEQCEMLIVVVSNEYFMSKWPMIELSAFVQAHKLRLVSKSSTKGPKIFPLFYGLLVGDLDDEGLKRKWFQKWESLAKADPRSRIVVSDWKHALDVLRSFNGLPYDVNSKEIVAYVKKIVSYVCQSISPDIRWDDSHVQGKSNILKVIGEKIEGIEISQRYNVKVVGLYGVGGIGKTTTCKSLCNVFLSKYGGRVCHIEFPLKFPRDSSSVTKEFFQKVVQNLTTKSMDVIRNLNEGQCKDILRKSLFKQRTFLVIDNFSESHQSLQLAKTMLELPYHLDSLVVVTARSPSVLELLGIDGDGCLEMPDLGESDAVRLFLQHAIGGKEFFEDEKRDIMTCVRRCYFSRGDGQDRHYHPLALQSLGLQLGCHGEHPSLWVKHLPHVKAFNSLPGGNHVFDVLRSGFDLLSPRDQTLLMDVQHFHCEIWPIDLLSLVCIVHKEDEEEITRRLEHLKRKGLLQDVDLKSGVVTMHDLYMEFIELEVKGFFNDSTNLRERKWVYIENGDVTSLKFKPHGGCWSELIRLIVGNQFFSEDYATGCRQIESLDGIKWKYFSNVEVLHLWGVHLEHGALNLEGLVCLRILQVEIAGVIDGIEGLCKLKSLTCFKWKCDVNAIPIPLVGQLPSSLELLEIHGSVGLIPNALARCHSLVELSLRWVQALSLDLSHCWCLASVHLRKIKKLETLSGLSSRSSSSLQSLKVKNCEDLVDILGIDHLVGLKELCVETNLKLEVPSLLALTELQVLKLYGQERFVVCLKDSIPHQLPKLHLGWRQSSKGLNLDGLSNLEELNLSWSKGLTSLTELGDLPALRVLKLLSCEHLLRLPDLSKSRNLEELHLKGCSSLTLGARDIEMLFELPLLQPLPFPAWLFEGGESFRLDIRRWKVLVYQSHSLSPWRVGDSSKWEVHNLGPPPIKIRKLGPFSFRKTEEDSSK